MGRRKPDMTKLSPAVHLRHLEQLVAWNIQLTPHQQQELEKLRRQQANGELDETT